MRGCIRCESYAMQHQMWELCEAAPMWELCEAAPDVRVARGSTRCESYARLHPMWELCEAAPDVRVMRGCTRCESYAGQHSLWKVKVKVRYIARYPVRRTAQSALHFNPWQTCSFQGHLSHAAIARRLFVHISTTVCIARYSFIHLSELWQRGVRVMRGCTQCENNARLNPMWE